MTKERSGGGGVFDKGKERGGGECLTKERSGGGGVFDKGKERGGGGGAKSLTKERREGRGQNV